MNSLQSLWGYRNTNHRLHNSHCAVEDFLYVIAVDTIKQFLYPEIHIFSLCDGWLLLEMSFVLALDNAIFILIKFLYGDQAKG